MSDLFFKTQTSPECSIVCLIYVERLMEKANVPIVKHIAYVGYYDDKRRYSSRWWSQSPSPGWHRSIDEHQTHQSTYNSSCSHLHLLWPQWSLPISQPEHRTENLFAWPTYPLFPHKKNRTRWVEARTQCKQLIAHITCIEVHHLARSTNNWSNSRAHSWKRWGGPGYQFESRNKVNTTGNDLLKLFFNLDSLNISKSLFFGSTIWHKRSISIRWLHIQVIPAVLRMCSPSHMYMYGCGQSLESVQRLWSAW